MYVGANSRKCGVRTGRKCRFTEYLQNFQNYKVFAAQSAYLIGAGSSESQPGKPAIFDTIRCERALQTVKRIAQQIERGEYNKAQIIGDATEIATATSHLATICREASV